MSGDPIFLFRETELRLAQREAAQQECHVSGQGPHGLKSVSYTHLDVYKRQA